MVLLAGKGELHPMKQKIYDPARYGKRMTIVCFVSGSGTNYREIVKRNPDHDYVVFTNRPGCRGTVIARENKHEVIEISHIPYLAEARKRYGPGMVPRNCPERVVYEEEICQSIEIFTGIEPDLICLAGYDQWLTDWMVDRYYPRILNVHPGDTTRGYDGLYWIPSTKAILAGEEAVRSTLFFVDKGEDTGPVLVQSRPVSIAETIGKSGGMEELHRVTAFIKDHNIKTYEHFMEKAEGKLLQAIELLSENLQEELKVKGDWKIFPFAVHDLIARGRVQVEGRTIYIDGKEMPEYGYRLDEQD